MNGARHADTALTLSTAARRSASEAWTYTVVEADEAHDLAAVAEHGEPDEPRVHRRVGQDLRHAVVQRRAVGVQDVVRVGEAERYGAVGRVAREELLDRDEHEVEPRAAQDRRRVRRRLVGHDDSMTPIRRGDRRAP